MACVFGGRTADGLSQTVWHSKLSTATPPVLGAWQEVTALPLPEARADATATLVGNFLYVVGGEGPKGITGTVYRLQLQSGDPAIDFTTNQLIGWATPREGQAGNLPAPRAQATSFTANGALYVVGGIDASKAPQATNFWTVPDATIGDITKWQELKAADLPEARAGAAIAPVGSVAFLIGGDGPSGPVDTTFRAGLSPKPPFFKLGMFGATIPALSIKGEIGQQLGYINAGRRGHDRLHAAGHRRHCLLAQGGHDADHRAPVPRPLPSAAHRRVLRRRPLARRPDPPPCAMARGPGPCQARCFEISSEHR